MSEASGLVRKLCEVMAEAKYVQKQGKNEKFNYKYATEADVVELLRSKLAARNIFVFPSVINAERKEHSKTSSGGTMFITDIIVKWTFIDGDTGEAQECMMPGCGTDTGDKGIYKAITGSSKYLFLKAFMLPTGDDPEDEKPEKESKSNGHQPSTEEMQANAKAEEVVTITLYKEGYAALSGKGLQIMKSNLDGQKKGFLGCKEEGNVIMISADKVFDFKDMCEKNQVGTILMDAQTDRPLAPPKAVIPAMPELDNLAGNEGHSTDPVIMEAVRRSSKKPGGKEFLSVTWNGKQGACFKKSLWPHLEHHVKRPAMLKLESKGQYVNVVGIESLEGVPFIEEGVDAGYRD